MSTRPGRLAASTSGAGIVALVGVIAITTMLFAVGITLAQEETGVKTQNTANAMALPDTYVVTVSLQDHGEAFEFSTVTAMRHFSLAPPDRQLRFRGRLWVQSDGRELLDFSVELGQQIAQKDGAAAVSRNGSWSGSAYVESGRSIKIVENPNSTITVNLQKR